MTHWPYFCGSSQLLGHRGSFPSLGLSKIKLGKSGSFSMKSTYNALTSNEDGSAFKHSWKRENPSQIKDLFVAS